MVVTRRGDMYFAVHKVDGTVYIGFAPNRVDAMQYCLELMRM